MDLEYALCSGCPCWLLRYIELSVAWPQKVVCLEFFVCFCILLSLPTKLAVISYNLPVSSSFFLCASSPDLFIIISCELGKQINKFIMY